MTFDNRELVSFLTQRAQRFRRGRREEMSASDINAITGQIIDAAMRVHTALGPGLLESVYEKCLQHELNRRGIEVNTQVGFPIV
jgi:hypothetical protein